MKQILIRNYAFLALTAFFVLMFFLSCKKDSLTQPQQIDNISCMSDETKFVVEKIKFFENQLFNIRQGTSKGDDYISVDSAMWKIESLFNARFSFPDIKFKKKVIQELLFTINIKNDMLLMSDVTALYDEIIISVKQAYLNDGIDSDKALMSVLVEDIGFVYDKLKVKVIVISGQKSNDLIDPEPHLNGPFRPGDCWYFGEYGGTCDDPNIVIDAAEILEDTINHYYGWSPEPLNSMRNIYVDLSFVFLEGNEYWNENQQNYYILYLVNPSESSLYLDYDAMNKYYHNEVVVFTEIIPNDPLFKPILPDNPKFMELNIDGVYSYNGNDKIYNHQNSILYGSQYVVLKEDLGTPIDLLIY